MPKLTDDQRRTLDEHLDHAHLDADVFKAGKAALARIQELEAGFPEAIVPVLEDVSEEGRARLFGVLRAAFCVHCGRATPGGEHCQCRPDVDEVEALTARVVDLKTWSGGLERDITTSLRRIDELEAHVVELRAMLLNAYENPDLADHAAYVALMAKTDPER